MLGYCISVRCSYSIFQYAVYSIYAIHPVHSSGVSPEKDLDFQIVFIVKYYPTRKLRKNFDTTEQSLLPVCPCPLPVNQCQFYETLSEQELLRHYIYILVNV